MTYTIPNSKLERLEKIIKKYQKKGANITFRLGDKVIEKGKVIVLNHINHCQKEYEIDVECTEVFAEGSYIINGWQFAGTIEFTENGNIIRLADSLFEGKVPAKYLHTPAICEHCGKIRNRKDTYLIYNADKDEFKQVGSSCLLDYTLGMDADKCADIMSGLNQLIELGNKDFSEEDFLGDGYNPTGCGIDRKTVLPIAYAYVKQYGYQRMEQGQGTAYDILMMLWNGLNDEALRKRYESLIMPSEEELKAIDDIARFNIEHLEYVNDYQRNASLAWVKESIEYRDFSLIASFINSCLKQFAKDQALKQKAESTNNEWVGNVGDRITIKVASARVLYTKDNSYHSYYAGCSYVMELIDTDGHVYKWSTSKSNIAEGDTVIATVKSHSDYKGIKQTVLTNGKVIR